VCSENVTVIPLRGHKFADETSRVITNQDIDVYYCPLLTLHPLDIAIPTVVCIPDVQHEFYPENFSAQELALRRKQFAESAEIADKIITISDFSKSTLLHKLNLNPDKVYRVHLASSYRAADRSARGLDILRKKHCLPERFGLYPAKLWPHKNHEGLLDALINYRSKFGELPYIILTGDISEKDKKVLNKKIRKRRLTAKVKHIGFVNDNELRVLYPAARFVIYPSFFEGFGLPALEALSAGVPLAASRITPLTEIVGEAAIFFDPGNPGDIARAIHSIHTDGQLREELITTGLKRAKQFTWEKTTCDLLDYMHQVSTLTMESRTNRFPYVSLVIGSHISVNELSSQLEQLSYQDYPNLRVLINRSTFSDQELLNLNSEILRNQNKLQVVCYYEHDLASRPDWLEGIWLAGKIGSWKSQEMIAKAVSVLVADSEIEVVQAGAEDGSIVSFYRHGLEDYLAKGVLPDDKISSRNMAAFPAGTSTKWAKQSFILGLVNSVLRQNFRYSRPQVAVLLKLMSLLKLSRSYGVMNVLKSVKAIRSCGRANAIRPLPFDL
jgi:glycosyltransferase involved in cell wall biosynthesis